MQSIKKRKLKLKKVWHVTVFLSCFFFLNSLFFIWKQTLLHPSSRSCGNRQLWHIFKSADLRADCSGTTSINQHCANDWHFAPPIKSRMRKTDHSFQPVRFSKYENSFYGKMKWSVVSVQSLAATLKHCCRILIYYFAMSVFMACVCVYIPNTSKK